MNTYKEYITIKTQDLICIIRHKTISHNFFYCEIKYPLLKLNMKTSSRRKLFLNSPFLQNWRNIYILLFINEPKNIFNYNCFPLTINTLQEVYIYAILQISTYF